MIKVRWMLLCQEVMIAPDGEVDLLGVFDVVQASPLPSVIPVLYGAVGLTCDRAESVSFKVAIRDSEGHELYGVGLGYDFTGPRTCVAAFEIPHWNCAGAGSYEVCLFYHDQLLGSTDFQVLLG